MFNFLKQVGNYTKETIQAAWYIGQGLSVTFDHLNRRPVTVQYPYIARVADVAFGLNQLKSLFRFIQSWSKAKADRSF